MKQRDVNLYVAEVMNNHLGRLNAIKFQDIEAIIVPMGATKKQIREAIRILRSQRKAISSRPNVGYYLDKTDMVGCKTWLENLRIAKGISPITPESLSWV